MDNDLSELDNWLECIFRDKDNLVHAYVYEAYKFIEAMDEPETVFNQYWDYEKLQPQGLRLKEMYSDTSSIDITSADQQKIYLEYLQKRFCNERFRTMADWFVFCSQKV